MLSNQFIVGQLSVPSMVLFISSHGSAGTTGGAQSKLKKKRYHRDHVSGHRLATCYYITEYLGTTQRQTQCLAFATLFLLLSSFSHLFALHRHTSDAICSRLTCYQTMLCVFLRFVRLFYSCCRYCNCYRCGSSPCCDDLAVRVRPCVHPFLNSMRLVLFLDYIFTILFSFPSIGPRKSSVILFSTVENFSHEFSQIIAKFVFAAHIHFQSHTLRSNPENYYLHKWKQSM